MCLTYSTYTESFKMVSHGMFHDCVFMPCIFGVKIRNQENPIAYLDRLYLKWIKRDKLRLLQDHDLRRRAVPYAI